MQNTVLGVSLGIKILFFFKSKIPCYSQLSADTALINKGKI